MNQEKRRLYVLEDTKLLRHATTMQENLVQYLSDFSAKFPWVNAAYATAFENEIKAARNIFPHGGTQADQKVVTYDELKKMEQAAEALYELGIYAQLAYPEEPSRRMVFGQEAWPEARQMEAKMVSALEVANDMASKNPYKTDLLNKGYSQAQIDALATMAEELEAIHKPKNKVQKEGKVSTGKRIDALNQVWKTMGVVHTCAQLVYRESYAKRRIFNMYPLEEFNPTVVAVKVMNEKKPLAQAKVMLDIQPDKFQITGKNGIVRFRSKKFPKKVSGEVSHPDFGKAKFTLEIKRKGKTNKVLVELG